MGWLWHGLASLAGVMTILFCYWSSILVFAIFGFFWEKTQHRYYWFIDMDSGEPMLSREKTGWFGWITKHRLIEAAGWPVGALVASVAWYFIK
jgi:hypothetical protein